MRGPVAALQGPELVDDLRLGREPVAHLSLVPELLAVGEDDEVPAAAPDELHVGAFDAVPDLGGQTGRARLVVSDPAVLDADAHASR